MAKTVNIQTTPPVSGSVMFEHLFRYNWVVADGAQLDYADEISWPGELPIDNDPPRPWTRPATYSWGPNFRHENWSPIYTSGTTTMITSILFKDSISSVLDPTTTNKWYMAFRLYNPEFYNRKPKPPRLVPLRPLRLLKVPTLRVLTIADFPMKKTKDGKPWKPKRVTAFYNRIVPLIEKRNKKSLARYNYVNMVNNKRRRAFDLKQSQIKQVNEKRQAKYELRLANWQKSLDNKFKHYIKERKQSRVWSDIDNPYKRVWLINTDLGTGKRIHSIYNGDGLSTQATVHTDPSYGWQMIYTARSHPLHFVRQRIAQQTGFLTSDIDTTAKKIALAEHVHLCVLQALDPDIQILKDKGVRKIYSKLSNSKVNVGNLIGERHQVLTLLSSSLKSLAELALLKKAFLKNLLMIVQNPRRWADLILAWRFGVEPLVADIQTAIKFLATETDPIVLSARTKDVSFISKRIGNLHFSGKITVRYCIKVDMDNVMFQKLNEWGLTNPLSVAWELTPWSFVVDWLIPIGEYIESLTALTGLSFNIGTVHITVDGTYKSLTPEEYALESFDPDFPAFPLNGSWAGKVEIREVLTDIPDFPLPNIKNPISDSHNLLAACLLIQKIKK